MRREVAISSLRAMQSDDKREEACAASSEFHTRVSLGLPVRGSQTVMR